tara:strand:+ start:8897 stop:9304 length:408 start_codon:yes stop_codon:yes gene_type:complete
MADIAWALIGASFAVLVAFLVPVLHQLRKTAKESELFFRQLNTKVDPLFDEMTEAASNCNDISGDVKDGVSRASHLFTALGKVGNSVDTVHHLVRGNAFKIVVNVASLIAGLRAATETMKKRADANKGGGSNGTL